jgi:hypothetical protein
MKNDGKKKMSDHETKRRIIENYVAAYNNFDVENMLRDMDERVVFRNISDGTVNMQTNGIDELRRQAEETKAIFSHREQKITNLIFGEAEAEAAISYHGTLAVDLPEGLKAGSEIALDGKSIFRFEGDKIIGIDDIS